MKKTHDTLPPEQTVTAQAHFATTICYSVGSEMRNGSSSLTRFTVNAKIIGRFGGGGCFPGRFYYAMPSCRRYISGLTAPSDNLMRRSLYHLM
ncbi:hypothetical protein DIK88_16565 [Salmonella enterica]|nr:hypothetical protein [Salmonella enterica]EBL7773636.1 hypothetical protein [Salmonella enterica]